MMFVNKIPSIIILFLLVLCLILLAILISTSESNIFILAQLILDKLKRFLIIITFEIQSLMQQSCITSFHVIHQCIVLHHDRESVDWLMGMRLSTSSWVAFGSYLIVASAIGLPLLISLVVVFSHVTLMPRRNLDSRVRCNHMIELLGARWCLGMCDVTHCNPLL